MVRWVMDDSRPGLLSHPSGSNGNGHGNGSGSGAAGLRATLAARQTGRAGVDRPEPRVTTAWAQAPAPPPDAPTQIFGPGREPSPLPEPAGAGRGSGPRLGLRAAIVSLVVLALLAAGGYAVSALTAAPPLTSLSAQVASTGQVALSFPDAGTLSGVFVRPGEHVRAHQLLATENVPGASEQAAASREAVTTDSRDVTYLKTLLGQFRQVVNASSARQQQLASAEVASAATALSSTAASRRAAISALQQTVAAAGQVLQSDQARYSSTCPGGAGASQACGTLAHEVQADQVALSSAKANLSEQRAAQADWAAVASRALSDARAVQQGYTQSPGIMLAPLEVDLANAQGQLLRDRAQLTTDQARASAQRLLAPQAGTVVSVSGLAGEAVSGNGVSAPSYSGGTIAISPGFQLFPSQQSAAGRAADPPPIVVLASKGPVLVNVVVPESQIGLVHPGAPATITPAVAGLTAARGVVEQIYPSSIVAAGVVSYEVQVSIPDGRAVRRYLAGMTATADIGR